MAENTETAASWGEILTREYASKIATLVLAIWLHAANSMLTATTMPSAIEDVGGLHLISWTFALYLMGSITAGAGVSLLVSKYGLRSTMIRAALIYGIGCVVCASAPNMPVILVGRTLQGLGGGGLVALLHHVAHPTTPRPPKEPGAVQLAHVVVHFLARQVQLTRDPRGGDRLAGADENLRAQWVQQRDSPIVASYRFDLRRLVHDKTICHR